MKIIKTDIEQQAFDDAIEELLAGDMDAQRAETLKQAAASDQVMASAIIDAWTLRKGLDELEPEIVPTSLQQRLLAIPAEHTPRKQWFAWIKPSNWQAGPSWAIGSALAMSLILAIGINRQPNQAEILQAREDIQIALAYLGKSLNQADQVTRDELSLQVQKILAGQQHRPAQNIETDTRTKTESIDL